MEMAKEFDLTVYYLSDHGVRGSYDKGFGKIIKWDTPLLEGYRHQFIKNYSWRKSLSNHLFDLINPGVFSHLTRDNAKIVIVNGWSYLSILFVIIFAKILKKQVWLRAENPLDQELRKKKIIVFFKKIMLKHLLFKLVDRALYIGTENKKFFRYYGIEERNLIFTPYSVNNSFFKSQFEILREKRDSNKREKGYPQGSKIILFVGKYIEKKRPLDLLKAFRQLEGSNTYLIMVGEGFLRGDMELFITKNKLERVLLTGFINQSEISLYYSIADIFVMCSGMGETWGLSVNEAMNFSLPIIVSETAGCSKDLVQNGVNGFVFPEGDVVKLKERLGDLLSNPSLAATAGTMSAKIVNAFTEIHSVKNLINAISER